MGLGEQVLLILLRPVRSKCRILGSLGVAVDGKMFRS
jgi:hypothetical protein